MTAGLGADAMLVSPPAFADPAHPTVAELRRAGLFFRGSAGQGFGRLFGPNVNAETGALTPDGGKIAGDEILAFDDDGSGRQNVAMLLQIPANLSAERRCLVAIPVNGSASLFRDIVDFGYWGLRHNCAVVYTDKGHGNGFHLLEPDTVNLLDGRQVPASEAGSNAHFRADLDDAARRAFLAEWPHRVAFKAAHSKQNPEKDWGENVLRAIRFAFVELQRRDPDFTPSEHDRDRHRKLEWRRCDPVCGREGHRAFDGRRCRPRAPGPARARRSGGRGARRRERRGSGRTLLDYFSFGNLYQPCALLAVPDIPLKERVPYAANRCQSLRDKGLLVADTLDGQARGSARSDACLWLGSGNRHRACLRILRRSRRHRDEVRQQPWTL